MEIRIANQNTLLSVETMVQQILNNMGTGGGSAPFSFVHDARAIPKTEVGWTRLTNTPITLTNAEAIAYDDYILTFGYSNTTTKVVYRYTPSTDSWTKLADAPEVLYKCHAVKCGAYIYVACGYISPYTKFLRYHPPTATWETLADLPHPITSAAGVLGVAGTDIYLIGGTPSTNYRYLRKYDTLTGVWTTGLTAVLMDTMGGSAWEFGGELYVLNSSTDGGFAKYTPGGTWKKLTACPAPCSKTAHGVLGGKLIIAGGDVNNYAACWVYDPVANTWSRTADNSISMSGGTGAVLGEKFYVFGTNYGYDTSAKASVLEGCADSSAEQIVAPVKAGQQIFYNVYGGDGSLVVVGNNGTTVTVPKNTNYTATIDGYLKSIMRGVSGTLRGWVR